MDRQFPNSCYNPCRYAGSRKGFLTRTRLIKTAGIPTRQYCDNN